MILGPPYLPINRYRSPGHIVARRVAGNAGFQIGH